MIGCIRATAPYGPAVGNRTRRGIRGAAGRRAGEPPSPGTAKREHGDRELIATSPLPRRPVRGGAMWRPGGIRRVKASHLFRSHRVDHWRGRSTVARVAVLGVLASLLTALPVASSVTTPARAASC